jgi:type IV pilus assembly protein PilM
MLDLIINRFTKKKPIVGIDIGSSSIKFARIEQERDLPTVTELSEVVLTEEIFNQYKLTNSELLLDSLGQLRETHKLDNVGVVVSIPTPVIFNKKIKVPNLEGEELKAHIEFESSNFIPQGSSGVYLDYHILEKASKNQLEVLVTAVKTELVDVYVETLNSAKLEVLIVDVDPFAFLNSFEISYPNVAASTAIVNIGHKHTGITVIKDSRVVFVCDMPTAGKTLTESIASNLSLKSSEAEKLKTIGDKSTLEACSEYNQNFAAELGRQLSYYWSASNLDGNIEKIVITGGGCLTKGLPEAITSETEVECEIFNPLNNFNISEKFTSSELIPKGAAFSVALGLALRRVGDRIVIEES